MASVEPKRDSKLRRESVLEVVKKHGYDRKLSMVPESGVLLDVADVAPSPCRDYCQIMVTRTEVIFRWWKISSRNDARVNPGEIRECHEDFLFDERCQSEIHRVFGERMEEYVKNLCKGHIDYLPRIPTKALVHICTFLDLQDIARLCRVSKQFRELGNSDELWEKIYRLNCGQPITPELRALADDQGWKKLFFTNKIQLQMQLRRKATKRH
ncbi:F-box only protein 36-like [Lineus longissimus]|uniref:F-box only protein 36-like n=1 Tax=Lineus longissimus TaxID=88925 RepID=UPI002B4EB15D